MSTDYALAYGTHTTAADGRCAMEWVCYLAGEPHSDEPVCVSPVLRAFCISLNDFLEDAPRQRLRPYLARTIGTADDGLDGVRSWMAMDWLIREYTSTWLAVAGLDDAASRLEALPAILDGSDLREALVTLDAARHAARDAWATAVDRSRLAARAMSWKAGSSVARTAAWSSAGAAAWAAARVAVGDIAGDRARACARSAAGDSAAVAARALRKDTERAAANSAARAALAPTLRALEDSSFALLHRMLPTETFVVRPAHALAHCILT
jgi:hypothetical protein